MGVRLSVCLSPYLYVHLYLSLCFSVCLCAWFSYFLSVCLSVSLPVSLPDYCYSLSVCFCCFCVCVFLYVCLSVCMSGRNCQIHAAQRLTDVHYCIVYNFCIIDFSEFSQTIRPNEVKVPLVMFKFFLVIDLFRVLYMVFFSMGGQIRSRHRYGGGGQTPYFSIKSKYFHCSFCPAGGPNSIANFDGWGMAGFAPWIRHCLSKTTTGSINAL